MVDLLSYKELLIMTRSRYQFEKSKKKDRPVWPTLFEL